MDPFRRSWSAHHPRDSANENQNSSSGQYIKAGLTSCTVRLMFGTPDARAIWSSVILILPMWLLRSSVASGDSTLLAKNTSFVSGTKTGASNAKPKPASGLEAICLTKGECPSNGRKSSSKIWKNGGVILVGLRNTVVDGRKSEFCSMTANDNGGTSWNQSISNVDSILYSRNLGLPPSLEGLA